MLDVGDTAPEFELPDQNGETASLSALRGERVVVYFYPRANTPGCTTEACGFRDAYDEFEDRGVTVFGISDDPVEDLKEFEEDYELPFRLLSDESGDVAEAYDSFGEKNVFGNVVEGVFRNTYVVDEDGTIALAYEDVTPEDHAEAILADLENL
ncbi:MAG: thioredoxin-dependent thiol peroxidase [Salinigranum sp.]